MENDLFKDYWIGRKSEDVSWKRPQIHESEASVSITYDRNGKNPNYYIMFSIFDSRIIKQYSYATYSMIGNSDVFFLVLSKTELDGVKTSKVSKQNNNTMICGKEIVRALFSQLGLDDGKHRVSIGRNRSKSDDRLIYEVQKIKER